MKTTQYNPQIRKTIWKTPDLSHKFDFMLVLIAQK